MTKKTKKQIKVEVNALYDSLLDEQFELLQCIEGGPRVFFMDKSSMQTIVGVLVLETDDSFLVAMPARLVEDGAGVKEIQPFLTVPYFRLQKSSVTFTSYLFEPFGNAYREYLESVDPVVFPELEYFLNNWKDGYIDLGLSETLKSKSKSKHALEPREVGVKSGMTDDELRVYLESRG